LRAGAQQLSERIADARAAFPISNQPRHLREGGVGVPGAKRSGEPREPRPEGKDLDLVPSLQGRMTELKQGARIGRHRPRDVEDQNQGSRTQAPVTPGPAQGLAFGPQRRPKRPPEVEAPPPRRRSVAARVTHRHRDPEVADEPVADPHLLLGQLVERFLFEPFDRTRDHAHGRLTLGIILVRHTP
jgi:hypothetical protein